jgi:hypothetical protein
LPASTAPASRSSTADHLQRPGLLSGIERGRAVRCGLSVVAGTLFGGTMNT